MCNNAALTVFLQAIGKRQQQRVLGGICSVSCLNVCNQRAVVSWKTAFVDPCDATALRLFRLHDSFFRTKLARRSLSIRLARSRWELTSNCSVGTLLLHARKHRPIALFPADERSGASQPRNGTSLNALIPTCHRQHRALGDRFSCFELCESKAQSCFRSNMLA